MTLSPQLKMNISKVAVITVCYVLISVFIAVLNKAIIYSPFTNGPSGIYDFHMAIRTSVMGGFLAGVLGGTGLVLINSTLFRKRSFRFALLATASVYVSVFILIAIFFIGVTISSELGPAAPRSEYLKLGTERLLDLNLLSYFIMWGVISLFTLFMLQVNDKFGPGILVKFLRGKYFHPRQEERVFMFLDMRSSTTIAEKIGDKQYFNLLSDLFSDITPAILNHSGEIYQYVGDEVVISWPLRHGIHNANCLACFMQIQKALDQLASDYEKKYGISPQLKAGLHVGTVTAGEIGRIKKDIVYSGDVLNTAARIQGQCNDYKVDILMSKDLAQMLDGRQKYSFIPIGNIALRGKQSGLELVTLKF